MKKTTRKFNLLNLLLNISVALFTTTALAQEQKADPKKDLEVRASDKVDLKKLEDKYWSAKDEDYGVIQNRIYSKTGKFYGSILAGTLINDPFAQAKPLGAALGYFVNEEFGLELSYLNHDADRNDAVRRLNSQALSVNPNYNQVKNSITLSGSFFPFYAKMAFLNKSILYFDMGFTAGLGVTQYDQVTNRDGSGDKFNRKSAPHAELGFVQQLFISKNIAFRIDFKNTFYSSKITPYRITQNSTTGDETKTTNDTTLTFGVTLFTN